MDAKTDIVDVLIVGGGPAGMSAAYTLAKAGIEPVVLERGNFAGAKNMFGGAIYKIPTEEVWGELSEAPVERFNVEEKFVFLGEGENINLSYRNQKSTSFTTIRANWDKWCADRAETAGAYICCEQLAVELIKEDGKIIGAKTETEEIYAKITIIADGVNSILARDIGLKKEWKPEDVSLSVKEVISLPATVIQDRLNVKADTGVGFTLAGGALKGLVALGFMYANKNSIALGIGVSLEDLKQKKIKPYELLNEFKKHPFIANIIEGGELLEYSAHMIPEGGYHSIPKLYTDGAMIVGDAAMLVNNVHFEGTNLAMMSGKFVAETAIEALKKDDFSAKTLSSYRKKLKNSFVMKDLYSYRNVMKFIEKNKERFLDYYPTKACEFMEIFSTADNTPKAKKYRAFIGSVLKERGFGLVADGFKFLRLSLTILFS